MDTSERLNTAKLSAALRQAMADMDARLDERDETGEPLYAPHGDEWHRRDADGVCSICLAGATFARFGVRADESTGVDALAEAGRISAEEWRMLVALDQARVGNVTAAVNTLRRTPQAAHVPEAHRVDVMMREELHGLVSEEDPAPEDLAGWGQYPTMTYYDRMAAYLEEAGL